LREIIIRLEAIPDGLQTKNPFRDGKGFLRPAEAAFIISCDP
jgi:hypothetical protein